MARSVRRNAVASSRVCPIVVLASLLLAPVAYRIVDLGVPPGAVEVGATAINNRGEVLVSTPVRDTGRRNDLGVVFEAGHGYLWRAGRFLDFGDPGSAHMGGDPARTEPIALNDHGVAVGAKGGFGAVFLSGYTDADAFVWRGGKMEDPGVGNTSQANGINNLGDIVGDSGHGAFARLRGKILALPEASRVEPRDPSGEMGDVNQSSAVAINDRRQILVNSTYGGKHGDTDLPSRPFLVDGNARRLRLRALPLPSGYKNARGYDLNAAGTVLAGAYSPGMNGARLYLVRRGRIVSLGMLSGNVHPAKINAREDVVATVNSDREPQTSQPLLWLSGRRVPFPKFDGWTLQALAGINDHGMICGTGMHDGKPRAFLLMPSATR